MNDSMSQSASSQAAQSDRKSGRAVFDERGTTTWEWQIETGIFHRDVTDAQLQRLEAPDLELLDSTPTLPRQYEGLWIHDAHRPSARRTTPRQPRMVAPIKDRSAGFNPLRALWAHLRRA